MRSLFAVAVLGALTLAGCDLNPPAPQRAAQATCNCTPTPPAAAPAPQAVLPAVTPEPAPRENASHHHVRHYAWHRRHHRDDTDYAYNYHSQSTYTDDTDRRPHSTEWTDGYGHRHSMWAEAGTGSDYDPRWRNDPYHGYDVNCPNPQH